MAEQLEPSARNPRPFLEIRPLLRALGIASDAKKLVLAVVGTLALSAGWLALEMAFGGSARSQISVIPVWEIDDFSFRMPVNQDRIALAISEPYRAVTIPFASLFSRKLEIRAWFECLLMAVWAILVWGIVGGSIARIAVVQAAGGEGVGVGSAVRFGLRKAFSLVGAPLTPLFAVAVFAVGCAGFGLVARIPWGIGSVFATVFGFVPLLLGLVMALILIGLAIGWPLMVATVAAEGEDAPDALSRSYSYVNQRFASLTIHVLAAAAIGVVGQILVSLFAGVVLSLADWGVGLGQGSAAGSIVGGGLFWRGVVGVLVHAWAYSYFWSAVSILYLIFRRDVDGTAWHDVYQTSHDADTFAGDLDKKAESAEVPVESA